MENKTTPIVAGIVVLFAILGLGYLVGSPTIVVTPAETKVVQNEAVRGASSDFSTRYISFGGVRLWAQGSDSFTTGSTTLCAIQAPQTGSSTLVKVGIDLRTSTGTAQSITIHKSNSQWVQTTLLSQDSLASGALGSVVATSTALDTKFGVNDWIVIRDVANSLPPQSTAPEGSCSALFMEI